MLTPDRISFVLLGDLPPQRKAKRMYCYEKSYVISFLLFIAVFFFISCGTGEVDGLKGKIQKELDGSPFLKEKGIKLTVIKEENGYVTIEMVEGSRIIRGIINEGVNIIDTRLDETIAYHYKSNYKDIVEGVHILRNSVNYIKKMDGVKMVLLKAAINTLSDQAEDLYAKGVQLDKSKKYTGAFKCFEKAADFGHFRAQINLGHYYYAGLGVKKDYEKAIYYLRKAAESDNIDDISDKTFAQNNLAWVYATCKDPNYRNGKKAVEIALKVFSQKPDKWNYNGTLAAAYARNGQFEKAIETGEKAIKLLKQDKKLSRAKKQKYLKQAYKALGMFKKHQAYVYEGQLKINLSQIR